MGDLPQRSWEDLFNFARDCGDAFLPAYVPTVEKHRGDEYSDHQRQFQLYRRGRYVEFNLVYDRGHHFWSTNQWPHRVHSDVLAAPGALGVWLYPCTRYPRSPTLRGISEASRLGKLVPTVDGWSSIDARLFHTEGWVTCQEFSRVLSKEQGLADAF